MRQMRWICKKKTMVKSSKNSTPLRILWRNRVFSCSNGSVDEIAPLFLLKSFHNPIILYFLGNLDLISKPPSSPWRMQPYPSPSPKTNNPRGGAESSNTPLFKPFFVGGPFPLPPLKPKPSSPANVRTKTPSGALRLIRRPAPDEILPQPISGKFKNSAPRFRGGKFES